MVAGKPKQRSPNLCVIRRSTTYSVQEAAELLDRHPNTVLSWIRDGLPLIDESRPFLIHGAELHRYLGRKRQSRKRSCAPGEMFCCRCRAPSLPRPGSVAIAEANGKTLRLSAYCDRCGGRMNRAGATSRLAEYVQFFDLPSPPYAHLTGQGNALARCDFNKESDDD